MLSNEKYFFQIVHWAKKGQYVPLWPSTPHVTTQLPCHQTEISNSLSSIVWHQGWTKSLWVRGKQKRRPKFWRAVELLWFRSAAQDSGLTACVRTRWSWGTMGRRLSARLHRWGPVHLTAGYPPTTFSCQRESTLSHWELEIRALQVWPLTQWYVKNDNFKFNQFWNFSGKTRTEHTK